MIIILIQFSTTAIFFFFLALRKCPDMKGNITFVTGKGLHSKNGIPILKTSLEEYLKDMHIQYVFLFSNFYYAHYIFCKNYCYTNFSICFLSCF